MPQFLLNGRKLVMELQCANSTGNPEAGMNTRFSKHHHRGFFDLRIIKLYVDKTTTSRPMTLAAMTLKKLYSPLFDVNYFPPPPHFLQVIATVQGRNS